MKLSIIKFRFISIFLCALFCNSINAQLGFCSGNSGDPIFLETFGSGTTNGPALAAGTTSYNYVNDSPDDGNYTISSSTNWFDWHATQDHTPNDTNGKCFIVNADFTSGEFFRTTISGLCENTTYEFSAWLLNLLPASGCSGNGIPVNVKFQIWDDTDTTVLATGDTGDIQGTTSPRWEQYGLVFSTLPGQTSVILKMINNGTGGCGNDLAIDDIVFKSCGDYISISNQANEHSASICGNDTPYTTSLTVYPDNSIFSTHFYQWQQSIDGNIWNDIPGANNATYQTPLLTTTTYYRAKVSEDAINLANDLCNVVSDVFSIEITTNPNFPISNGDLVVCEDDLMPLSVTVTNNATVNWYDSPNGGNLLASNTTTYQPENSGVYFAEAVSQNGNCTSVLRTALNYRISNLPVVFDEDLEFCEGDTITLQAGVSNMNYVWSTGETSETIRVSQEGEYTVIVTNTDGCSSVKTLRVTQIDIPVIDTIESVGNTINITMQNTGDFEYSLDGYYYQSSPVFYNVSGNYYNIHVRELNGCGVIIKKYLHFVVPSFFTPNNDGINDTFLLIGIETYELSEVSIFDRYGKLLKSAKNESFSWNGTFNNIELPSDDYWYVIKIDNQEFIGHFTLKR
ncbi:T9SS type B sorting domain-containing protein [Corallibacter sp.]|uniref:T9SS type B sorting domain-containing protein n=1 Tax=Corallibacter sp. TaxID=2038084 RepID=UPI003AB39526